MTWRERRLITILSAIVVVLVLAVLVVLGIRYNQARNKEVPEEAVAAEVVFTEVDSSYHYLTYCNGSATLSFEKDEYDHWHWADDPAFPLDETVVLGILDKLQNLKPQQTLTEIGELEDYSLDNPSITLTASTKDGQVLSLAMGKATDDGKSRYTMVNEDATKLYIIAGDLLEMMQTPIYDMYVLPELPQLTESQLRTVLVRSFAAEEGAPAPVTVLNSETERDVIHWTCNGTRVTGDETVKALLADVCSLKVEKCVDYRPSEEAAKICGFNENPVAGLILTYTKEDSEEESSLMVSIGEPDLSGTGRYVRIGSDSTIYLLPTAALDPLMRVSVYGLEE